MRHLKVRDSVTFLQNELRLKIEFILTPLVVQKAFLLEYVSNKSTSNAVGDEKNVIVVLNESKTPSKYQRVINDNHIQMKASALKSMNIKHNHCQRQINK